jgi:hypothetical protein
MDHYIDIRVSVSSDLKDTARARCEELLVHSTVADNDFVKSVVVLRNNGFGHLLPDESTRQER